MGSHSANELILWFDDFNINDIALVGGKNASLGEMYQYMTAKGVAVPHGFAITAHAYRHFIDKAGIKEAVQDALAGLDTHDLRNLQQRGKKVQRNHSNGCIPG